MFKKITIIEQRKPSEDINELLNWFSRSFGLVTSRDVESSCFRVFIEFVKNRTSGLKSDELAGRTNLSRGAVVYHIHRLENRGLIVHHRNKYFLRACCFREIIMEIKKDTKRIFDNMEELAEKLDNKLKN